MPRAKNVSLTKIGVVWQKSDFWTKNRDFGPKKSIHFLGLAMFWPRPEKVVQRKKVPSSETEFFLEWSQWESSSPGYSGYLPHWQKSQSLYKKLTFGPKYPIFGSKKIHFPPSGQLEPHRSMFSTRKRCLIGIPIRGYQNVYSLPKKNWILGPKTAKFGPKLAFWAKYRHFWPIWSNAWPKNNADKLSRWFFHYVGTKTFTYSHKN